MMNRREFVTTAASIVALAGCSQQRPRRPKRRPPPADVDLAVDILPVIVGDSPRWAPERLQAAFDSLAPAWAEAKIKPTFLAPERVDGSGEVVIGSDEARDLQRDAYLASGSVVIVHFSERLTKGDNAFGGMAFLPWNAPGPSQHGVFVSSYGLAGSTLVHELGHHLGLLHADENGGSGPAVPKICADKTECTEVRCSKDAMSYCGPLRQPTGPHSFTVEQEARQRYWAAVRPAFRAVSEQALRAGALVRPEFTDETAPVVCGG